MTAKNDLPIDINSLFTLPNYWVMLFSIESIDSDKLFFLLSADEKKRADSFKSQKDRACFIGAHAFKRYSLSQITNTDPNSLTFSCSQKGKPFLEHHKTIDFNISHSDGWVAFGVTSFGAIGVDIERADRIMSKKTIEYVLNPQQLLKFEKTENPVEKMIIYWTQKEAVSKALGLGISIGFKNIESSGEFGESQADCNDQQFTVQSYQHKSQKYSDIVLSVATQSSKPVPIYELSNWANNTDRSKNTHIKTGDKIILDKLF